MKTKRSPDGLRLCQQRRHLLVTQAELGAAIGKTSAWVSLVELGKHQPCSADVKKLEHFLNCHSDELEVRGARP